MTASSVAKTYFDLSNARELNAVFELFAEDATYSSDNTGLYFGLQDIRNMMSAFFETFPYLHWEVHSLNAATAQIIEIEFTLTARNAAGEESIRPGIERIVVVGDKIRHVEVRNSQ